MGIVREPDGVDFIVKSRKLTKKELQLITDYITAFKAKQQKKTKLKSAGKSDGRKAKAKSATSKK